MSGIVANVRSTMSTAEFVDSEAARNPAVVRPHACVPIAIGIDDEDHGRRSAREDHIYPSSGKPCNSTKTTSVFQFKRGGCAELHT